MIRRRRNPKSARPGGPADRAVRADRDAEGAALRPRVRGGRRNGPEELHRPKYSYEEFTRLAETRLAQSSSTYIKLAQIALHRLKLH